MWPSVRGVASFCGGGHRALFADAFLFPAVAGHGAGRPWEDDMAQWKGRDRGREEGDAYDRWVQG